MRLAGDMAANLCVSAPQVLSMNTWNCGVSRSEYVFLSRSLHPRTDFLLRGPCRGLILPLQRLRRAVNSSATFCHVRPYAPQATYNGCTYGALASS